MKAYKFIFMLGFLNLVLPFVSVPSVYKNYAFITIAIIALGYSLILRTVEKEREGNLTQKEVHTPVPEEISNPKTIEEVVDMVEIRQPIIVSDVVVKRRGRKPKVITHDHSYE